MSRMTKSKIPRGVHFTRKPTEKAQSYIRECKPGNPWFEGAEIEDESPPKFVARKSCDLLKIRSHKDRVEALLSSPMIDARPRGIFKDTISNISHCNKSNKNSNTNTPVSSQKFGLITPSGGSCKTQPEKLSFSAPPCDVQNNLAPTPCLSSVRPHTPPESGEGTTLYKGSSKPSTDLVSELLDAELLASRTGNCIPTSDTITQDPTSFEELRHLVDSEVARLRNLCDKWSNLITQDVQIPEAASDSIRNSVGQCQLMISKKISFLVTLIDDGEKQLKLRDVASKTALTTSLNDVLGYWSLVATEITLIDSSFERLHRWRSDNQWNETNRPVTPARSQLVNRMTMAEKRKTRGQTPKRVASLKITSKPLSNMRKNTKTAKSRKIADSKLKDAFVNQLASEIQVTPSQASGGGRVLRARPSRLAETLNSPGLLPDTPIRTRSARRSAAATALVR